MADSKISGLTADTSPTTDDLLVTVNDPGGTPGNKKVTVASLFGLLYPIGSIYISTLSTNPATLLGVGTWAVFGAGKTLVSLNSADTDFDTSEETGGAKTVAGASHTHALSDSAYAQIAPSESGGNSFMDARTVTGITSYDATVRVSAAGTGDFAGRTVGVPLRGTSDSTAASATSVVQPYIVVYMWKRTA